VYELVAPDVLVLEYESVGRYLPEDRPYANHYIGVYRFAGDRIASVREFYDPTRAGR
jgi:ketosteroid isomerase-like protein